MTQKSVATPTQNYLESEDLVFEIGDEETETKKKRTDDDHVGYGIETESEDDEVAEPDDSLDEFEEFEWGDEADDIE